MNKMNLYLFAGFTLTLCVTTFSNAGTTPISHTPASLHQSSTAAQISNARQATSVGTTQIATPDPSELIRVAIEDVMSNMRSNEALYKENPQQFQKTIEKTALPYLNIPRMAQLTLGKNWKSADENQRSTFIREFQTYLVRSYINTLYEYRATKPEILSRDDNGTDKSTLKVSVKSDKGNPVVLFFRLEKTQEKFQIIDVIVEGVSLIVTDRSSFNDEISKKGMDGFIQSLIEQNKKAAIK